jgi:hypothetical protein
MSTLQTPRTLKEKKLPVFVRKAEDKSAEEKPGVAAGETTAEENTGADCSRIGFV